MEYAVPRCIHESRAINAYRYELLDTDKTIKTHSTIGPAPVGIESDHGLYT